MSFYEPIKPPSQRSIQVSRLVAQIEPSSLGQTAPSQAEQREALKRCQHVRDCIDEARLTRGNVALIYC